MLGAFETGALIIKFIDQTAKAAIFMLVFRQLIHESIRVTALKAIAEPRTGDVIALQENEIAGL
ncbi:MAG: hypothetical protein J1E43_07755 [Christensenellaceae bacterium]|nr:hypothetical protein [Christensenellaceae bacterium]